MREAYATVQKPEPCVVFAAVTSGVHTIDPPSSLTAVARQPGERRCPVPEELRHDWRAPWSGVGVRRRSIGYACARFASVRHDGVGHVPETFVQALLPGSERLEAPVGHIMRVDRPSVGSLAANRGRAARRPGPDTAGTVMLTSASVLMRMDSLRTRGEHAQNLVLHHP